MVSHPPFSLDLGSELYLGLLLLVAGERLVELRLSARNARRQLARGAVEYGRGHYLPMVVFHALFLLSCAAELLWFHPTIPLPVGLLMLLLALAAQALRYWAVSTLGDRWNTRIIVRAGDLPVTLGPYRLVRHPNYVAVALELFALPLVHGCWRTALFFSVGNAVLLAVRIPSEERALGLAYREAFADRPRFIPAGPTSRGVRHGQ
jgi:methyltransferase